jgi:hypothetical protein
MAKFRQRGKTWSYNIYLGLDPLTKKCKEISKGGFKTQREAKAAARLVELEIQNGTFTKESDMPFEQFSQDWLKTHSRSGMKISSVRAREKERSILPLFGDLIQSAVLLRKCMKKEYWNFKKIQPKLFGGYSCLRKDDFSERLDSRTDKK